MRRHLLNQGLCGLEQDLDDPLAIGCHDICYFGVVEPPRGQSAAKIRHYREACVTNARLPHGDRFASRGHSNHVPPKIAHHPNLGWSLVTGTVSVDVGRMCLHGASARYQCGGSILAKGLRKIGVADGLTEQRSLTSR